MVELVTFEDLVKLVFDTGRFDDYRVTLKKGYSRWSPTDVEFFEFFLSLGDNDRVWETLYNLAQQIDENTDLTALKIPTLTGSLREKKMLSAYAAAVLAEERKAWSKLGKRVKLLGYYQVLKLGYSPQEAANWSRGKGWRTIARECEKYGL